MIFHAESRTLIYGPEVELPAEVPFEGRGEHKLVKATYGNLVALAAAGLPVPSPMLSYDWPCRPGQSAMPTQQVVSAHMVLHPRSYVFSDMRTGKTRAALWACDWLMSRSSRRLRAVVTTDLMAMRGTWVPEITSALLGRRSYAVLHGTPAQRIKALGQDVDFYLINHDGLKSGFKRKLDKCTGLAAALLERDDIQLAVFDEAATYRNKDTMNWRAAHDLVAARATYVWALTGTPTPNGPLDAYGLKRLIDPTFKAHWMDWRDHVTEQDGPFRRRPRVGSEKAVHELLSPAVRIARDQCFVETDEKTVTLDVPLSETQRKHMKILQTQLVTMLEGGQEIPAVNQAALRAKLIQIACGAVYGEDHASHDIDAGPRLDVFKSIIDCAKNKMIVFSPLTNVNRMLSSFLGPRDSLFIDSRAPKSEREDILRRFNAEGHKVLLGHPATIARGLDLTVASTIIYFAPVDRTEYYLQANQRINGPRQTRQRNIIRLCGSEVEREIYNKLERNESMQNVILRLAECRI